MIQEVSIFRKKTQFSTRRTDHCFDKVLKLYDELKVLHKSLTRTEDKEKEKRSFCEMIDDFFDIAHSDAFRHVKI